MNYNENNDDQVVSKINTKCKATEHKTIIIHIPLNF